MTEWMRTDAGLWERTKGAAWAPDIRCDARLIVRGRVDEKGALSARDDEGRLRIRILSSTPDIDEMNEIVEVDAFRSSLGSYNERPILLAYHDMGQPVGLAPARITSEGLLHDDAFVSSARPDVQQLVLDGVLAAASIGFMVKRMEYDEELEVGRIKDLELIEVSLVPIPANRSTFVEAARGWCATFAKAWRAPRPMAKARGALRVAKQEVEMPDLGPSLRAVAGAGRLVAAATGEVAALIAAEGRRIGEGE